MPARKHKRKSPNTPDTSSGLLDPSESPRLESTTLQIHLRRLPTIELTFASCLFVGLVIFVYVYSAVGENFVDSLSSEVGELVSERAAKEAAAGNSQEAITLYQEALKVEFTDEKQRIWTMQNLTKLLLANDNAVDARVLMQQALVLDDQDPWNYLLLGQSYQHLAEFNELLSHTNAWAEFSQSTANQKHRMFAHYYAGIAYLGLQDESKALVEFLEAHRVQPDAGAAWNAAKLLDKTGRAKEAVPLLNYVQKAGKGSLPEQARQLKSSIERRS